ncbi:MAG: hypothetical protein EHM18_00265 [Acidobacteria bacterium]|nr:MAG: hypothetical protein EHM18_00265 [Acidobacteriota bacterium]
MKGISFSDPAELFALLKRRKAWVIFTLLLLFPCGIVVAWLLPGIFVSETLILIEPRDVPDEFVKNLISVSTEERLSAIQETVLSRTNLLRVIYEFPLLRGSNEDDQSLITRLRDNIAIDFQERKGRDNSPVYFKISYQNRDPNVAQKVTARLAVLFIEYDSRTREDQVFGTAEFLNEELQKVAAQLGEVEGQLRIQQEKYRFELPEQLDTNLRSLDRLQEQAKANTEAIDRYVSMRLSLEREISQTPTTVTKATVKEVAVPIVKSPNPAIEAYRLKKAELDEMTAKYTDRHPDVLRVREEVARIAAEIPPEDLAVVTVSPAPVTTVVEPNPVYQKLQSQLDEVKTEIAIREKERVWIQGEIVRTNTRIQNTPQREQEIKSVEREHEELSKQYENLKGKLADARLAESLESKQKGSQFVILDPASLPVKPAKPNRLLIAAAGFILSLFLGFLLAFLVDVADQKVWTRADLEKCLAFPILAEIPELLSVPRQRQSARRNLLQVASACVLLVAISGGLAYLYYSPSTQVIVSRQLDRITAIVRR